MHGKGRVITPDGKIKEGEWINGRRVKDLETESDPATTAPHGDQRSYALIPNDV